MRLSFLYMIERRPSAITHGKEQWYDLEIALDEAYHHEGVVHHKYYVVDAFADPNKKGTGNPAAVVPLTSEPMDVAWMQLVAQEINQSETAFVWKSFSKSGRVVISQLHRYGTVISL
jgi:Phenazine biosynthesis-like protein